MYWNVIARTCRTCHAANPVASLQFDAAADLIGTSSVPGNLGSIEALVCSANVMPHAKKTFLSDQYPSSFWASTSTAPGDLQAFGNRFGNFAKNGWLGNQCTLPSPPPDPFLHPNTTQINIEQVFQKKCAWCHYNPVNPGGYNFQQGQQNRTLLTGSAGLISGLVASGGMPLGCAGDYCLSPAEVNAVQDWFTSGNGGFK
jgi:cytochrome c5